MKDRASSVILQNVFSSYSYSPQDTFIKVSLSSSPTNGEIPDNLEIGKSGKYINKIDLY